MSVVNPAQLKQITDSFETKASQVTAANDNAVGRWKRVALAAEKISGTSSVASDTETGWMLRAAKALEAKYGVTATNNFDSYDGLLKRIADAIERNTGVLTGTFVQRIVTGIGNLSVLGPELVSSPNFASATPWTLVSGATIVGGQLNLGTTQFGEATQNGLGGGMTVANGDRFTIVVVVATLGNMTPVVRAGQQAAINDLMGSTPLVLGTNTFTFTAAAAKPNLGIDVYNSTTGTVAPIITSISVKKG